LARTIVDRDSDANLSALCRRRWMVRSSPWPREIGYLPEAAGAIAGWRNLEHIVAQAPRASTPIER